MGLMIPFLAILLVVGSFMWMRPSARDQFLAKLRAEALTSGFRISSLKIPNTTELGRIDDSKEIVTVYVKNLTIVKTPTQPYTVIRTTGESGIYLPDGWQWHERVGLSEALMHRIATFVATLPESVTVVSVSQTQAAISWDEKDPSVTFEHLSIWLTASAELINRKIHGE